jgi:hypothetical protein
VSSVYGDLVTKLSNKCAFHCCRVCGGWTKSEDYLDNLIPAICPRCGDPHHLADWSLLIDAHTHAGLPPQVRRDAIRARLCLATVDGKLVSSRSAFPGAKNRRF